VLHGLVKPLKFLKQEQLDSYKLKTYKILLVEVVLLIVTVGFIHATLESAIWYLSI